MSTMDRVCEECRIPLRPARVPLANAPGTRTLGGGGLCDTCWRRAKRHGAVRQKREAAPDVQPKVSTMKCVRCGRPMRGHRNTIAEYPGTVEACGGGHCRVCWQVLKNGEVGPVFDLEQARSALEGYLAERRKRLGRWAA